MDSQLLYTVSGQKGQACVVVVRQDEHMSTAGCKTTPSTKKILKRPARTAKAYRKEADEMDTKMAAMLIIGQIYIVHSGNNRPTLNRSPQRNNKDN